jgi:hypothetical protein
VPDDRNKDREVHTQRADQAKTKPNYKAYTPKPAATDSYESSLNEELHDIPENFMFEPSGGEAKQLRPKNYSRAKDYEDEDSDEGLDNDEIIELKEIKRQTTRSTETFSLRADFK